MIKLDSSFGRMAAIATAAGLAGSACEEDPVPSNLRGEVNIVLIGTLEIEESAICSPDGGGEVKLAVGTWDGDQFSDIKSENFALPEPGQIKIFALSADSDVDRWDEVGWSWQRIGECGGADAMGLDASSLGVLDDTSHCGDLKVTFECDLFFKREHDVADYAAATDNCSYRASWEEWPGGCD